MEEKEKQQQKPAVISICIREKDAPFQTMQFEMVLTDSQTCATSFY